MKLNFKDIDRVKNIINEYMNSQYYEYFMLISKKKSFELYSNYWDNYQYHADLMKIILSYQRTELLQNATTVGNTYRFLTFSSARGRNVLNMNQLEFNLKKIDEDINFIYLHDHFFHFKVLKLEKSLKQLYNIMIGFLYFNGLKRYIPNVIFTYAYFECLSPIIKENKVLTWCNISKNDNVSYSVTEYIDGMSIDKFIEQNNSDEIVDQIVAQYYNLEFLMENLFGSFVNHNKKMSNLLILELEKEIDMPMHTTSKDNKTIDTRGYFKTKYVLYLVDFSDISIKDYSYTSSIDVFNGDDFANVIKQKSGQYKQPNLSNRNDKKIYDISLPSVSRKSYKYFISDCIKYQCDNVNFKDFRKYITREMVQIKDNLIQNSPLVDLFKIYNRYIKLINTFLLTNNINYINEDKKFNLSDFTRDPAESYLYYLPKLPTLPSINLAFWKKKYNFVDLLDKIQYLRESLVIHLDFYATSEDYDFFKKEELENLKYTIHFMDRQFPAVKFLKYKVKDFIMAINFYFIARHTLERERIRYIFLSSYVSHYDTARRNFLSVKPNKILNYLTERILTDEYRKILDQIFNENEIFIKNIIDNIYSIFDFPNNFEDLLLWLYRTSRKSYVKSFAEPIYKGTVDIIISALWDLTIRFPEILSF